MHVDKIELSKTVYMVFLTSFFIWYHRMSNMSDSAYGEDYESSGSPGVTMHKIQKSSSLLTTTGSKKTRETTSSSASTEKEVAVIKHSKSSGKLERKVSFSEADPIKIGCIAANATGNRWVQNKNQLFFLSL